MNTIKKIKKLTLLGESASKVLNIDHMQINKYLPNIVSFLKSNKEQLNKPELFTKGESILNSWTTEKHKKNIT